MGFEVTNIVINGININSGLVIIFGQCDDTMFPILSTSVDHGDGTGGKVGPYRKGLLVSGTNMISEHRGIQWDTCQIGVSGVGPQKKKKKKLLKNDRYDYD
jgi:hypothetical protein